MTLAILYVMDLWKPYYSLTATFWLFFVWTLTAMKVSLPSFVFSPHLFPLLTRVPLRPPSSSSPDGPSLPYSGTTRGISGLVRWFCFLLPSLGTPVSGSCYEAHASFSVFMSLVLAERHFGCDDEYGSLLFAPVRPSPPSLVVSSFWKKWSSARVL